MNGELFDKLVKKASELALADKWGEEAYKINKRILKIDGSNSAACTRLAKYFRLNDDLEEAKNMYSKALEINPYNQGAKNNLIEIEAYQQDEEFVDMLPTSRDAYDAARTLAQKRKYRLSIKCFIKAYSLEPLSKYVFALARVYKKLGRYDDMRSIYTQFMNSNPSHQNIDVINAEFTALLQSTP